MLIFYLLRIINSAFIHSIEMFVDSLHSFHICRHIFIFVYKYISILFNIYYLLYI